MYPKIYPPNKMYPTINRTVYCWIDFIWWIYFWIHFYRIYFCALTLTVYNNLHQCSWFDNCVITKIEVANIVCDVDNLLISWWLMHRGKLTTSWFWMFRRHDIGIVCTVENLLHRVYRRKLTVENLLHRVYRGKLTVENLLHRVYRGKHTVDNLLHRVWCWKLTASCEQSTNIWHCVWCGKLTDIVVINAPRKTYCIVCFVENLLWKTYCGKLSVENLLHRVYRGKLIVDNLLHRVNCQQTFGIMWTVNNWLI